MMQLCINHCARDDEGWAAMMMTVADASYTTSSDVDMGKGSSVIDISQYVDVHQRYANGEENAAIQKVFGEDLQVRLFSDVEWMHAMLRTHKNDARLGHRGWCNSLCE
jgi:hypothetical protein